MVSEVSEKLKGYSVKVCRRIGDGRWALWLFKGVNVSDLWPLEESGWWAVAMETRIRIAVGHAVKKVMDIEGLTEDSIRDAKQAAEFTKLASEMFAKALKEVR